LFCTGESEIAVADSIQDCDIKEDMLLSNYIPFEIEAESPLPENIFCDIETESSIPDCIAFNLDTADDSSLENVNVSTSTASTTSGEY